MVKWCWCCCVCLACRSSKLCCECKWIAVWSSGAGAAVSPMLLKEGMERMSSVRLAPCGRCSRHGCAAATGPTVALRLNQRRHQQRPHAGPCGLPLVLSTPWHGDFPRSIVGASSPLVRCEAVLLLPPCLPAGQTSCFVNASEGLCGHQVVLVLLCQDCKCC